MSKFDGKVIAYVEEDRRNREGLPMRDGWIRAMRRGEEFGVPFFHRLAVSAQDLREVRQRVREKGAVIIELDTGRRSDDADDLADMLDEARDFWSRRGLTAAEARALGKLGAAASPVTKAKTDRCPDEVAEAILNDHTNYPTLPLAIIGINGVKREDGKRFKRKWTVSHVFRQAKRGRLNLKPRRPGPRIPK